MSNPSGRHLTEQQVREIKEAIRHYGSPNAAAKALGGRRGTFEKIARKMKETGEWGDAPANMSVDGPAPAETPKPQMTPAEIHDAAFWRRKAKTAQKQAAASENALREIAGMCRRELIVPRWTESAATVEGRAAGLIHLSDLHAGEVVRSEDTGGFNEYTPEIFQRRVRRMISASMQILPRWAADCRMQGVVLALNGDLISGDIHDELRRTNSLTSHEQVMLVTDELAGAIERLADHFGAVMVTVTPGNHGRTTERTHAKRMAALSYDTMVGNILERQFRSDSRVTINISSGPDLLFKIFGWSILQTHGDSMGTGGGQGFAGPELPIVRGGKKVRLAAFAAGEHYDVMLTAHYHTSSNPGTVLANGSIIGYNEYAQRIRAVPEPPQQWLALIHEKWALRERVPVVLEDPGPPRRPRVRVPAAMSA